MAISGREITDFRDIVKWIYNEYQRNLRQPGNERLNNLQQKVARTFNQINNDLHLEKLLPSIEKPEADFTDENSFLYLPPVTTGDFFLPIMTLKCSFEEDWELRIQLSLLLEYEEEIYGLGFRYESSEGDGRHDYCHAQFISEVRGSDIRLPKCPEWLPTSEPTMPLNARSPFELILCVLISLYGITCLSDLPMSCRGRISGFREKHIG